EPARLSRRNRRASDRLVDPMQLNISDETSALTDLCVCRGTAVPACEGYQNSHPEFDIFETRPWDREKLLVQQDAFYEVAERHGARLHFVPDSDAHHWALYTRDTGFVIGDTLYYARDRQLPERIGEIDNVLGLLPDVPSVEITAGRIEGGDVMPDGDVVFVGLGTRTDRAAANELATHLDVEVMPIDLGPTVMHLDTRMTILPGRRALICTSAFSPDDLFMLDKRLRLIEVSDSEAQAMGTNVFVINPETVVVHAGFPRIIAAIEAEELRVVPVDWSEPNALLGSFRCATMPLARSG
ncbi:MAG: dimethylarginine dimethylaminohydrolase family protein, partial [Paracoccaceae bacterium]